MAVATYIPTKWILAEFTLASGKTINLGSDTFVIVALQAGSGLPNVAANGIQFLADVLATNPEDTRIGSRQTLTGVSFAPPTTTSYTVNFKFNNVTYNQNATDDGLTRYFAIVDTTVGVNDATHPVLLIIDPAQTISTVNNPVILNVPATGLVSFAGGTPTTSYIPEAPDNLTATVGQTSVQLVWDANSPNDAVSGYNVYREPQGGTSATLLATVTTATYTDSSSALTPNSQWTYYVTATNLIGTSAASNTVNATIPQQSVPTAPTGFTATANTSSVSLSWTANPSSQNVTGYNIYREPYGTTNAILVATVTGTSYTDASSVLTSGSQWTYYLTATNSAGTSPSSATQSVTIPITQVPSAPTGFTATALGVADVSLSWAANPTSDHVTGYNLYREPYGTTNAVLVVATAATSYTDTSSSLTSGSQWTYYLTATNAAGTSASSATQSVTIPAAGQATYIAPLYVGNIGTTTMPAQSQVSVAQPFAPGDIPTGNTIQLKNSAGAVIASQQDQESTWLQDGSTKVAALSILSDRSIGPAVNISSISWANGTATVTTSSNHNLPSSNGTDDNRVYIQNIGEDIYNGIWSYTWVSATQFTIAMPALTISGSTTNGSDYITGIGNVHGIVYGFNANGPGVSNLQAWNYCGGSIQLSGNASGGSGSYTLSPMSPATVVVNSGNGDGTTFNATAQPVVAYSIWSVSGSRNRSSNVTLSNLTSGHDFKLLFSDASGQSSMNGATWQVSVNDIVTNGHGAAWPSYPGGANSGSGWGTNPVNGWEIIRTGPVCTEWRFWSCLKCSVAGGGYNVGAIHPWLRGVLYVRAWGTNGPFEILGSWQQVNSYGANPGSSSVSSITTNNANDLIIATYRMYTPATPTVASNWTGLCAQNYLLVQYQIVSSTQSGLIPPLGSGDTQNGGIGDAIVAASGQSLAIRSQAPIYTNTSGTSGSVTLPTCNSGDIVYVSILLNGSGSGSSNSVSSVTNSNLTFTKRLGLSNTDGAGDGVEAWYAIANSTLSNTVITVNFSAGTNYVTICAFAVSGANSSSPFDSNSSLPTNLTSNTSEPAYVFNATLNDGNTVLNSWGGPNDWRSQQGLTCTLGTGTGTAIDVTNSLIYLTKAQFNAILGVAAVKGSDNMGLVSANGYGGTRNPVMFSVSSGGSLPAPLQPNTVYWLAQYYNDINQHNTFRTQIYPSVANAYNGNGVITLTSAGSGTMTIIPVACSFLGSAGLALDAETVSRTWQGTRSTLLAAHDFTYLTTKTRILPPYIAPPSVSSGSWTGGNTTVNYQIAINPTFSQGSAYFPNTIGGYGDYNSDDRIGYMMQHNCHQLYRPFDVGVFQMDAAIAASCWETGTWMFIDETIGIPSLLATTKSYPNLGTQYPPSAANPQNFNDRAGWLVAQSATGFGGGSGGGFYPARDHSPSPEIMPYLKTGDYVWIESLLVAQSTSSLNVDTTSYTFPNNQNYSFVPWTFINYPFNGNVYGMADTIWGWGRGKAWCCRTMGFGLHITPATRPELPYFRDRHADAAHCALLCTQYIVPSDGQILANYVVQTQDSGNGNTVGATAQWEDDFMFLAFAMEAWKGEYADWLSLMTNYFYRHCPGYLDENPSSNNPLINGSAQPPGVIWPMGSDGNLFIGQGGVFAKTWDDMYALSANYAGPGYGSGHSSTTGTITAGSNVISNIATFPGSNPPSLLFWNAVPTNSGVTPTTFYFPSYSFGGTVSGNSLTLRAYPGTNINPVASGFTGTINVTVIWNGNPIPWPGRADVISRFPDYIDFGYPGGDSAADPTSYHNIATSAVGLASILYSVTGNSVFQNAAAIYNEIRRRQGYMGGLPSNPTGWASAGNNPLTFRNWPKYGIGPIGSPY